MFGLHFRRFNINVSAGKALGGSYWVHYSIGGGDATGDSALAAVLEVSVGASVGVILLNTTAGFWCRLTLH